MNEIIMQNVSEATPDIVNAIGNVSANIHHSIDNSISSRNELNIQRVINNANVTLGLYQAASEVAGTVMPVVGNAISARESRKIKDIERQMQADGYQYNLMNQDMMNNHEESMLCESNRHEYKMQVSTYQYQLISQNMENEHELNMFREKNRHEEEMEKEFHRHQEFVCVQQRMLIEKALDVFQATFNRKMDFFEAQLKMIDDVHREDTKLLNDHIWQLEEERSRSFHDNEKYLILSNTIDRLHEIQQKKENEYYAAHSKLTDAVTILQIESQNPLLESGNNLYLK